MNNQPIQFVWDVIDGGSTDQTHRAKVFGGWIVRNFSAGTINTVFVPDPNHEWNVK